MKRYLYESERSSGLGEIMRLDRGAHSGRLTFHYESNTDTSVRIDNRKKIRSWRLER